MVGIGGIFGTKSGCIDKLSEWLSWNEDDSPKIWNSGSLSIACSTHSHINEESPTRCEDGLLWLWGMVHSHRADGEYRSKRHKDEVNFSHTEYAAEIINEFGIRGISRLNGQFSGVFFDKESEDLFLFTDRLGSKPIYYCERNGELVFSSNIQSYSSVHLYDVQFHLPPLYEFLTFGGALGIGTPVQHVKALPPASIFRFDLSTGEFSSEIYWRPTYNPKNKPIDYFVDELNTILGDVISDIYDEQQSYGLLLSGGSDSRILSDLIPEEIDCFHMNDWMDREARIAKKVATVTENNFIFLERNSSHYSKVLKRSRDFCNFTSWFDQGHILGYDDLDMPDCVLTGQFSDEILGGHRYPTHTIPVPFLEQSINIPLSKSVHDLDQYIELWLSGEFGRNGTLPDYLQYPPELYRILMENIHSNDSIDNHHVEYNSIRDMNLFHSYYPLSNTFTFGVYKTVNQMVPLVSPFTDYRIIDLAQSMPIKYHVRGKIVERAIKRKSTELAAINYPKSGLSLNRHPYLHYLSRFLREFKSSSADLKKPYYTEKSPWVNHAELIRTNPFLFDFIESKKSILESLPFIDETVVEQMRTDHLEGENNRRELYALATLISTPLAEAAVDNDQ